MITDIDRVGALLQATLVEVTDIALQGKQAHWNIVGPRFLPVHQQLDTLVDDVRAAADGIAERAVAIGYHPDGRPAYVAERTPLGEMPLGPLADTKVVHEITDKLRHVADAVRERVGQLAHVDPVSQDLLIKLTATLDKHAWMFGAQAG